MSVRTPNTQRGLLGERPKSQFVVSVEISSCKLAVCCSPVTPCFCGSFVELPPVIAQHLKRISAVFDKERQTEQAVKSIGVVARSRNTPLSKSRV